MNCLKCGCLLDSDAKFCGSCGTPVSDNSGIQNQQSTSIDDRFVQASDQVIYQNNVDNNQMYVQATSQENNNFQIESPEEKKAGNKLALYSLLLTFFAPTLISIIVVALEAIFPKDDYFLTSLFPLLSVVSELVGFILMIVCRVKYPKNTFGKVIMWIYIVMIIANVITLIIGAILFGLLLYSCSQSIGAVSPAILVAIKAIL